MFTGLIDAIGTVTAVRRDAATQQLIATVECPAVLQHCDLGASIAVDGVCLTVTHFTPTHFTVGLSAETEQRTTLSHLRVGGKVNCEKSLTASSPIGGHFVQGHVDSTARITRINTDHDCLRITFQCSDFRQLRFVVEKGYVAIDGTSLTVTHVDDDHHTFSIMLIQYTQSRVTLAGKRVGDDVNVEFDIFGKQLVSYIERYKGLLQSKL